MSRNITDTISIMRLAIGRRNPYDSDSTDTVLLQKINDFMELTMSDEFKIQEKWSTYEVSIDETLTDGVYEIADGSFVNLSGQVMISRAEPVGESTDWFALKLYQDPGDFYSYWGINNEDNLIIGTPTEVLYYDNKFVFRTIPDDSYIVHFYAYIPISAVSLDSTLPFAYWMRLIAYGAARQYAADYRLNAETTANIERNYSKEKRLLLTRMHNKIKYQRGIPRF